MKSLIFLAMMAVSLNALAQPVMTDGNNRPSPGFSAPVSSIMSASTDIYANGANHTWDFGSYTFIPVGTMTVSAPSSLSLGSSFPSANYAYSFAGTQSYFNFGTTQMEALASLITATGGNNDYTANPKTLLKFPFNFNDSISDTYIEMGSTNNITVKYDGYGTLIMPSVTYNNVVRTSENYGPGQSDYSWWILNPLMQVAIYDHNTTTLYHIATTQSTNVDDKYSQESAIIISPNPAQDELNLSNLQSLSFVHISDMTGKVIFEEQFAETQARINCSNFVDGIYFIQITNKSKSHFEKIVIRR